jgi:hypothetical protein
MPIEDVVTNRVSHVDFVQDYLQINFSNPPHERDRAITFLGFPTVQLFTRDMKSRNDRGYCDDMSQLVNCTVSSLTLIEDERLEISFSEGHTLSFAMNSDAYLGPEILNYHDSYGFVSVW